MATPGHVRTLVFFDIDGTLVQMAGAGRKAFCRALREVYGLDDNIAYIQFSGGTDLDVLGQIARRHGLVLTPEKTDAFFGALDRHLEQTLRDAEPILFPGVAELLQILAEDDRFLLGLVTGNIESCAFRKLAYFELHRHFLLGAFGHEHADRIEIARLARERALEYAGPEAKIAGSFLVGDTPSDIAAAHGIGATAIAVATGMVPARELQAAGADHVLEDFSDPGGVLRLLRGT